VSCLGANYEPLVGLGAAAAVTERIELITAITIVAELVIAGAHTAEEPLRETLHEFERRGCDDFLLFPASADPEHVDLLARAIRRRRETCDGASACQTTAPMS
jgi:hypothetical protein